MTTEVTELAIVKKIMSIFKLDEAGKIDRFFRKEIKSFKNQIRDLNNLLTALKNKHDADTDRLKDAIEDAKESVVAAYYSITMENVVNNEAMQSFSSTYWTKIDRAEAVVNKLEKQAEELTKVYEEDVKSYKAKITKIEERIAIITK